MRMGDVRLYLSLAVDALFARSSGIESAMILIIDGNGRNSRG